VTRRVPRLSTTLRRSLTALGVHPGSAAFRAVMAAIAALAKTDTLPGPADHETGFSPGRAHVRRVQGHNLWLLYRFDADYVFVMTARSQPPVPTDDRC